MRAKDILKKVFDESKKRPCADVEKLADEFLEKLGSQGEDISDQTYDIFWRMLYHRTYTDPISGTLYFYADATI